MWEGYTGINYPCSVLWHVFSTSRFTVIKLNKNQLELLYFSLNLKKKKLVKKVICKAMFPCLQQTFKKSIKIWILFLLQSFVFNLKLGWGCMPLIHYRHGTFKMFDVIVRKPGEWVKGQAVCWDAHNLTELLGKLDVSLGTFQHQKGEHREDAGKFLRHPWF